MFVREKGKLRVRERERERERESQLSCHQTFPCMITFFLPSVTLITHTHTHTHIHFATLSLSYFSLCPSTSLCPLLDAFSPFFQSSFYREKVESQKNFFFLRPLSSLSSSNLSSMESNAQKKEYKKETEKSD